MGRTRLGGGSSEIAKRWTTCREKLSHRENFHRRRKPPWYFEEIHKWQNNPSDVAYCSSWQCPAGKSKRKSAWSFVEVNHITKKWCSRWRKKVRQRPYLVVIPVPFILKRMLSCRLWKMCLGLWRVMKQDSWRSMRKSHIGGQPSVR